MSAPNDSDGSTGETAPPSYRHKPEARPRLNALGEERPAFMLEFPDDPELEALMLAFELGNFAKVRAEAKPLAQRTSDEAVRRAALELRRRIDPDPLILVLLGLSIALFVFLAAWVYAR
jgi:hypothetical protein